MIEYFTGKRPCGILIHMEEAKKRILVVCQHYWPETFRVTDICEGLVENGYGVDVLCGIPNYPKGQFFEGYSYTLNRRQAHNGVNIRRAFEIPRGNNSNFRIFVNYASFPLAELAHLPRLLRQDYDRIMVYQLSPVYMAFMPILLSKWKRIPLYIYICDFWPHSLFSILDIKNKFLRNLITKFSYWHYKKADGLMGVFEGIAERLHTLVGIPKEKITYIPQVCEKLYEQQIHDEKLRARFCDGKFNIVFAGNINPAQAFDTVTAAAKLVKDAGYTDIRYIILGEGMTKQWLVDEVKRLGMEDNWAFEGLVPVEDVPRYQTLADALLVALTKSDLFEYGIPAKVQSYMAAGKPILSSMDGAGYDLINNSGAGLSCGSGDVKGLAKIIMQLYDMPTEGRAEMGAKGKEYHFAHFERNVNLKKLIDFVFHNSN